jgi:hypothetical protein
MTMLLRDCIGVQTTVAESIIARTAEQVVDPSLPIRRRLRRRHRREIIAPLQT